jgi:quercetin dioxygenase-like cupin family protein
MDGAVMLRSSRELHNPRTGQRMRILLSGEETGGARLRIESVNPPHGVLEPVHVHPRQESSAEVRSGTLRFVVAGRERRLAAGDTITIAPGVAHTFVNDGDDEAVSVQEFRPALRSAEFFATYFGLAQRGELDEQGRPSMLRFAALGPAFADEIRLVRPPWVVQRAVFALLGPFARRRGYGA